MPMCFATFAEIWAICAFQDRCWSRITCAPRNFTDLDWGMDVFSISIRGVGSGTNFLWKQSNINVVLLGFRDSRLALNQSFISGSSVFMIWNNLSQEPLEAKTSESFAKPVDTTKWRIDEALGRSLINRRNKRGPSIEPWGIPCSKVRKQQVRCNGKLSGFHYWAWSSSRFYTRPSPIPVIY